MYPHDSILGGLNLFKLRRLTPIPAAGERPPFPVINDDPTFANVVNNLNRADFGVFVATCLISLPLANKVLRSASDLGQKRMFYNSTLSYGFLMALSFALINSQKRLQGHTNNGLTWKYNNRRLKKYDFNSEYEQGTVWKYFRAPRDL